ncbi:MAG: septation protein IspZ [Alphaproteobacteria bacterium]|nr:septation protein IspZ [Alphaproteobacteria bacterium]
MQLLFALLPLVAFYVVESAYGLKAGVAAAMGFALLDVGFGWYRTRKLSKMALFTAGLVLVLGSLSLLSDDERFVLWSPVVGDLVFAVILVGSLALPASLIEVAYEESSPEQPLDDVLRRYLRGLTLRFALNLCVHAALTGWATTQSREVWLFVSGPAQYVLFGVQVAIEALVVWRLPPAAERGAESEQSRP